MEYKDRRPVLILTGFGLLLIGTIAAFLGPIEMYSFYLFSEGGRFHYEGFGFGSFMFGNIALQIMGYYVIAILFIPLGYGHVTMRRWARPLALALLKFWLVVGLPLIVVFFLVLVTAKELSLPAVLFAVVVLILSYFALPGLLIRFYQGRNVRQTFESRDPNAHWIEAFPLPILVLCFMYALYAILLHVPIFFNGLFPFFGIFFLGQEGILLLAFSIAALVCLAWGTFTRRYWAWWGSLIYFGLMALTTILTFVRSSYVDILSAIRFPPAEMEILGGVPLQGYHLAAFFGVPLLTTFIAVLRARRHFRTQKPVPSPEHRL
jgi:hypothetical protein